MLTPIGGLLRGFAYRCATTSVFPEPAQAMR